MPAGKCHGKGICDKMFQKIGSWIENAEERCFNVKDLIKACLDGQAQANKSKQRRTGNDITIFRAYEYKMRVPTERVDTLDLTGMHSTGR